MLLLLLSHFSRARLCATPWTASHQAPLSLGFSRQEHWSGYILLKEYLLNICQMALWSKLQFFLKLYLHTQSCMSCSRRQSSPVHTVRAELAVGTVPARRLQANRKLGGPAGTFPLPQRPTQCPQPGRGGHAVFRVEPACAERTETPRASEPAPLGRVPGPEVIPAVTSQNKSKSEGPRGESRPRISADLLFRHNGKAVFNVCERLGY